MNHDRTGSTGFTLIELLVSITVLLIVVGGAIAGFINFRDRREAQESAKQVQQLFVMAQQKVSVREVPQNCIDNNHPLRAYRVQILDTTPQQAQLQAICIYFADGQDDSGPYPLSQPGNGTYQILETITLANSVDAEPDGNSFGEFYTLEGGFMTESGATSRTYTFSGADTYSFSISAGGSISNVE